MWKHMFLIGRELDENNRPHIYVDARYVCQWPLPSEADGYDEAKAYLMLIDGGENLPKEVKDFCAAFFPMQLRVRYNNGKLYGPFILNDDDGTLTIESIESFFRHLSFARWNDFSAVSRMHLNLHNRKEI